MIVSKKLFQHKEIIHGFFNRNGGISKGIYKSLNCGIGSKDKRNNVMQNLKIVKKKIGHKTKNIFLVKQDHTNEFVFIDKNKILKKRKIRADAIITNQKKFPIAVLTADCAPLLIYENKKNMIAAIHAGWKGAFKEILKKVINFMLSKGCKRKNLIAAIGPCISQSNYEVREDFFNKFLIKDKKNKSFFIKKRGQYFFDLRGYLLSQLKLNKISKIDIIKIDTFNSKNNFFSARRSLKLKHNDYGRNISIIMIN
tara:strand:+ start:536 stop:1297 length:762 start_codon:yes stop_codon:yes gene_type:complete